MKFHGKLEELQQLVGEAGIAGQWTSTSDTKCVFRSQSRGVLNWWPETGTISVQGGDEAKTEIEEALGRSLGKAAQETSVLAVEIETGRRIFVVHGHDTEARDQLELVLRRLGLEPFILMNTSGGGMTIIEALEGQIGRDYSAAFGIVLLTPDDFGYAKGDGPDKAEPRARQNVILETGMLLSSLTRERIALLVKGHVEMPSDLQGIIEFRFNEHVREIVPKLCERLREAGIDIDASKIASASA